MRPAIRFDYESIRIFVPQRDKPTVYRIYNGSQLVYAGSSVRPRGRLMEHLRKGEIIGTVVELQFCNNQTAMLRAEREALLENPLMNNRSPGRNAFWKVRRMQVANA